MLFETRPPAMPRVIKYLLIINVVMYMVDTVSGGFVTHYFSLYTPSVFGQFQIWRLLTYMFLHDTHNFLHILINMLILWMFGISVVSTMGERRFLSLYLTGGIFAGLCSLIWDSFTGYHLYVGASGALFTIMVAFAKYFPRARILILLLFPMEARWAVMIFMGVDLWMLYTGSNTGIAYITHLGGAAWAFIYFRYEESFTIFIDKWKNRKQNQLEKSVLQSRKKSQDLMSKIDPILEKISKQGMESLTAEESDVLQKASSLKKQERSKIVNFDDYRKGKK